MNHPNKYRCSLNQHLLARYIFVHTRNNSFVHTRNVQNVRIPYILSIYISGGRNVWIFIQVCSSQGCTWAIPFVWRQIHPAVRTWDVVWMSCASREGKARKIQKIEKWIPIISMSLLCYTMAMVKNNFIIWVFSLGSPSVTLDHFLLKILFIGISGVTDPFRNQI
jgi:hypothetical protein